MKPTPAMRVETPRKPYMSFPTDALITNNKKAMDDMFTRDLLFHITEYVGLDCK